MKTRQQRLQNECTHNEYFSQFVSDTVKNRVKRSIGINRLLKCKSYHLFEVPLQEWDALGVLPRDVNDKIRDCGDFPTMAGTICIYKTAARQLIEENRPK